MNDFSKIEDLTRKIDNLIQIGEICSISRNKALAKVNILGRETDFLPIMSFANSHKKTWDPVKLKEQVLVLSPYGNLNNGFVLRSIFNKFCKEPEDIGENKTITEYASGEKYTRDEEKKETVLELKGDFEIKTEEGLTIKYSKGNLKIDSLKKLEINLENIELKNKENDLIKLINKILRGIVNKEAKTTTLAGLQPLIWPEFEREYLKLKKFEG